MIRLMRAGRGKIATAYRDTSLWKKTLLGYVSVIVLPFSLFIAVLANSYFTRASDLLLHDEQRAMQREYGSLAAKLSQLGSYHLLFQNDKMVNRYMSGLYYSVGEEIESVLTDIQPLFAFISSAGQNVHDLTVYCLRKPLVPLPDQMLYKPEMADQVAAVDRNGQWFFESGENGTLWLKFHSPLYKSNFSQRLGLFELTADADIPARYLADNGTDGGRRYLLVNGLWYRIAPEGLTAVPAGYSEDPLLSAYLKAEHEAPPDSAFAARGLLINRMQLPELDALLVSVAEHGVGASAASLGVPAAVAAALFTLLSVLYYLIVSSFARRILKFSKYIAQTDYHSLTEYKADASRDEIGRLVRAYNGMILRIRELVSDLNIAELKKREADYFALQAQMRPHFLYNALETARMIADANGDEEAGDFLFNLGGFIRYSITSGRREVPLETELQTVGKYLGLYKASMGDRLTYTLDTEGDISQVVCPPFVVQPLVENCLHHAINDHVRPLRIEVSARQAEDKTVITVRDNGKGIAPELLEQLKEAPGDKPSGGLGIGNTRKRLNDYFRGRADLTVESGADTGTCCTVTIMNGHRARD